MKRLAIFMSVFILIASATAYAQQIDLNRGLVRYYPFEGNARNALGTGGDGQESGGFGYVPGKIGSGLYLDGTDGLVTADALNTTGSITIAAWVQPDQDGGSIVIERDIFDYDWCGTSSAANYELQLSSPSWQWPDNGWAFATGSMEPGNTDNYSLCSHTRIFSHEFNQFGKFYFVVGVYDAQAAMMNLYLNGTLSSSTQVLGSLRTWPTAVLRIGQNAPPYAPQAWKGIIDELRIYERALSAAEVAALFNLTVGPVTTPLDPVVVNTPVNVSAGFSAQCLSGTTAVWNWGDGSVSEGHLSASETSGTVSGSHSYSKPGVYTVALTVTDGCDRLVDSISEYVVVFDPSAGSVTGNGWIDSPTGAYTPDPSSSGKATFGFVSRYQKGATVPSGDTQFKFQAATMNFRSTSYQWLVVAGPQAKYKGEGTINGSGRYGFLLTAVDGNLPGGGGTDRFRIQIWDYSSGRTTYDNLLGADATPTALGGGSIMIHK